MDVRRAVLRMQAQARRQREGDEVRSFWIAFAGAVLGTVLARVIGYLVWGVW